MSLIGTLNDVFIRPDVVRSRSEVVDLEAADAVVAQPQEIATQGVFVDPKSLASFPIAAAVVTTLAKIAERMLQADPFWVALAVSFAVGALIVAITMTEPTARPKGRLQWTITIAIAVINSGLLFAAVVGIDQIAGGGATRALSSK
jgi:hypothetical protein